LVKKRRDLAGRVLLSLVLLSGFFSAQGIFLSHWRRRELAKKEIKAKKCIHERHVTSLKRMRQPFIFGKSG
jgi:hypothetical protein